MSIKTKKDWWNLVIEEWSGLKSILARFVDIDTQESAELFKVNHMHQELHHIFEEAWGNAPDIKGLHCIPGWDILCDLCSEYWVFDPGEGQ